MPAVQCIDITKSFRSRPVLEDLSFTLEPGRALALVGPSGSGKTTALRILAGLEVPDHGQVTIDGRTVTGDGTLVPPWERGVGMVFQDLALWPHLRVRRQLVFVMHRMARRERIARASDLLLLGELEDKARQFPAQLSGGEQQRLAILRALAPNPLTLLMDEPFSHLDQRLRDRFSTHFCSLKARGVAIVVATHHEHDVAGLADSVVRVGV